MSQKPFSYKQGQFVKFAMGGENLPRGEGKIVGVSTTELPIIGCIYMVEVTDGSFPSDVYPFTTISVLECQLTSILTRAVNF